MFKTKSVIMLVSVSLLMIFGNTYSQDKEMTGSSECTVEQTGNNIDPHSGIFKLYSSKQTQYENTSLIEFELGEDANVTLTVYDSKGTVIETLINDIMNAGVYNVNFKSPEKIIRSEFTYKLEVKGVSGVKNIFAVK